MTLSQIDDAGRQFLVRLHEQTRGDLARQVSMYAVGESLGWDRESSAAAAQGLIAAGLVRILTLSGGIGISAEGAAAVQPDPAAGAGGDGPHRLGPGPVMSASEREAVFAVCAGLKQQAGSLGLDFEALAELVADIRSISAQLESPRPKTAVVRECLRSLREALKGVAPGPHHGAVNCLLGD